MLRSGTKHVWSHPDGLPVLQLRTSPDGTLWAFDGAKWHEIATPKNSDTEHV